MLASQLDVNVNVNNDVHVCGMVHVVPLPAPVRFFKQARVSRVVPAVSNVQGRRYC